MSVICSANIIVEKIIVYICSFCCKPDVHCEHFYETQTTKGCTMFGHSFTEP